MSQNSIILYFVFAFFFMVVLNSVKSLYKFFFFSEILWILLFLILLSVEVTSNTSVITINVMFILVFTAIEALLIACIFLLNSRNLSLKI